MASATKIGREGTMACGFFFPCTPLAPDIYCCSQDSTLPFYGALHFAHFFFGVHRLDEADSPFGRGQVIS